MLKADQGAGDLEQTGVELGAVSATDAELLNSWSLCVIVTTARLLPELDHEAAGMPAGARPYLKQALRIAELTYGPTVPAGAWQRRSPRQADFLPPSFRCSESSQLTLPTLASWSGDLMIWGGQADLKKPSAT